jgi:DNA helicase-2/ATP-dependent DNA helicase PcrA
MQQTPQQTAIISAYASGASFAVRARAGTGKTSTLEAAFRTNPAPALYVVFNRRNASEAKERMPETIECKTLNALGHKAWWKHTNKRLRVDSDKLWHLAREIGLAKELQKSELLEVVQLVRAAKVIGIPAGFGPSKAPSKEDWLAAADFADIDEPNTVAASRLLAASAHTAFEGYIDFDDQLYMPVIFGATFDRYNRLAIDEAQDLSRLQHQMINKMLAPKAQLVVVGDDRQAIYAFRGADENSFDTLQQSHNLPIFPLSRSFRCPRAIIDVARRYVPDIEAASNRDGTLHPGPAPKAAGTTILCRWNAPLIRVALRALRSKIPINYLGRDFTSGLLSLHKKAPTIPALEAWAKAELAKGRSAARRQMVEDKLAAMQAFHEAGNVELSIRELMAEAKSGQALTLSTIHKAKGLEWQRVGIISFNPTPEPGQEENAIYVAVTRSQNDLWLEEKQ